MSDVVKQVSGFLDWMGHAVETGELSVDDGIDFIHGWREEVEKQANDCPVWVVSSDGIVTPPEPKEDE